MQRRVFAMGEGDGRRFPSATRGHTYAMRIEDRFTVPLPVPDAWKVLIDLERVAPCMPGAQLQEVDGDEYRGVVKVKLGAITAQFKGVARFEEVDEDARRVVLKADGREIRGQGNASATVTAALVDAGDGRTEVSIDTDLNISGRIAQFGRGIMGDVSSKLLGEFARCLEEDLTGSRHGGGAAGAGAGTGAALAGAASTGASTDGASSSGPRKIESAEPEPLDLLSVAGPSVAERAVPAGVFAVLVLLIFTRRISRRILLAAVGAGLVGSSVARDLKRT